MDAWKNQVDQYNTQVNDYQDRIKQWQDVYTNWKEKRVKAVGSAEGILRSINLGYGTAFDVNLVLAWAAMGIIMAVFLTLIFVVQKRKDVAGR